MYVWFELMLLSSFVLLTLGGERGQLEGAIKYVTLNLLSSMLFLISIGLIYGMVGTLNMADIAVRMRELDDPKLTTVLATLLLVSFGIKAAVFPFFFWLPASYHTPPPAVSALFSGLLTKVGVYAIIRVVTLIFNEEWSVLGDIVLAVAGLTMVTGVLGAVVQNDMRRILSFHIVSQIGYMLMGLGIAIGFVATLSPPTDGPDPDRAIAVLAMAGAVFYILHHIIVKANLFLISGAMLLTRGSTNLKTVDGVAKSDPFLAVLFLIASLSLAGMPILSGFWAKLVLVRSGLEAGFYTIVVVSLCVSLLTLYSMTKIWTQAFWGESNLDESAPRMTRTTRIWILAPIVALNLLTISIGIWAEESALLAMDAAAQLLDPSLYIDAVFKAEPGPILEAIDP
ncbi:MAG: proton-conducting transporter membrane subunit, partial [Phycisphaerales bacterium]